MSQLKNDRFLRAIWRKPLDRTPVWMMRQAGRYLPEYRALRARAGSFMQLCQTPELAAEVTLQPLKRFPLDAAILFSDILTIPDALGLGLSFDEGHGPRFAKMITNEADIDQLIAQKNITENLQYVYESIKLINDGLAKTVPLIGFCGSPWTVAAYMLEGKAQPGFPKIQKMLEENPNLLHKFLNGLANHIASHLNEQIKSGVDAVMIFDTWGGLLSDENYLNFSLKYIKNTITKLLRNYNSNNIPVILFTKGGSRWLNAMLESNCDCLGVDWEISLQTARKMVGAKVALQGNLNPACLLESPEVIREEVSRILQEFGKGSGHIFNLGHGITPDVSPDHVAVFIDAVQSLSTKYHEPE